MWIPSQGTSMQEEATRTIKASTMVANLWLFVDVLSFNKWRVSSKEAARPIFKKVFGMTQTGFELLSDKTWSGLLNHYTTEASGITFSIHYVFVVEGPVTPWRFSQRMPTYEKLF